MILFGSEDRYVHWLGSLPQARALWVSFADRRGLREQLANVPAAGDVSLVLAGSLAVDGKCTAEQLCDAAQELAAWAAVRSMRARVILVSSASVYGSPTPGIQVQEKGARPTDGAGKVLLSLEEQLGDRARRRGFSLFAARLFEVLEPRGIAGGPHVELARRVKKGELGAVPGLGLTRDYLDARDLARAVSLLAQVQDEREPSVEAINVCSGRAVTGHELLRQVRVDATPVAAYEELLVGAGGPA